MIPELGHFAFILAITVALSQLHPALSRQGAVISLFLFALSLLALLWSFITLDFTVVAVAEHMHTLQTVMGRMIGMLSSPALLALLAVTMLSAARLKFTRVRLAGLVCAIAAGLVLFALSPFERLDPPPFDGIGYSPFAEEKA